MRFPVVPALLFMLICIATDCVIYKEIIFSNGRGRKSGIYKAVSILLILFYLVIVCIPKRSCSDEMLRFVMWGLIAYLSVYIPKILFLLFQGVSCVTIPFGKKRKPIFDKIGLFTAVGVFLVMWWGALVTRTNFEIRTIDVGIKSLPESFDGLKIVHITDLHLGTYGKDTTFVHEIVEEINRQHPDIIVFTGDIVNRRSTEIASFVSPLSRLQAKYGVYSVLGNHDYGDYFDWTDEKEREQDVSRTYDYIAKMGWRPMDNESAWIHYGTDSIAIVGVGNISRPPFKVYGNLEKAYPDLEDGNVKILLSHNPDHWNDEIKNKPDVNIQLTLSGHTHAMQFEIGGFSPASVKYDNWGTLSSDSLGRKLYVNKGLGTEGVPFRIGAVPEISLITLKADNSD